MPSTAESNTLSPDGIKRRKLLTHAAVGLVSLNLPWTATAWGDPVKGTYARLSALSRLPALEKPLLIMQEFQSDTDVEIRQQIFRDIAENRNILRQLQGKFGANQKTTLSIENMEIRLLYVPEFRRHYRIAYEHYCRNVIAHILKRTQTDNISLQIISPSKPMPTVQNDGVSAFLVHRLAKEYRVKCCFRAENGQMARYLFEGACFSNRLGAVEVTIENPAEGIFKIARGQNTIWQNRCDNLYSLLQVPVEETLHYILGTYTDKRIIAALKEKNNITVAEAERLANGWLAVEEAVVGGLGNLILQEYLPKYSLAFSVKDTHQAWQTASSLPRYQFRKAGIELAAKFGFGNTLECYKTNPVAFQNRLISS